MKTLVLGASTNPDRYAYKSVRALKSYKFEVVPIGIKPGEIDGIAIQNYLDPQTDVDTITLYLGKKIQSEYYNYILNLHPRRIIFNPGTENEELEQLAHQQNIETLRACTLVMLATQQY